ncbi:MAG: thioredoxin-dependent thiol peroxidase [Capnocytophaga sp.]|nr:thioredoxin-dependent thiol peroxidase [Capnocytophaga sp.]
MNTLQIGDFVPDFTAKDQNENPINLSDYKGKKLIFFFYPKASTPGCTAEACSLRDGYQALRKLGYELLGVSADNAKKQLGFAQKNDLPFRLIADEDHTVLTIFGVWGPKKFMGREYDGIHRMTFVLNEEHQITHRIDKVKTKEHTAQLLELLQQEM